MKTSSHDIVAVRPAAASRHVHGSLPDGWPLVPVKAVSFDDITRRRARKKPPPGYPPSVATEAVMAQARWLRATEVEESPDDATSDESEHSSPEEQREVQQRARVKLTIDSAAALENMQTQLRLMQARLRAKEAQVSEQTLRIGQLTTSMQRISIAQRKPRQPSSAPPIRPRHRRLWARLKSPRKVDRSETWAELPYTESGAVADDDSTTGSEISTTLGSDDMALITLETLRLRHARSMPASLWVHRL